MKFRTIAQGFTVLSVSLVLALIVVTIANTLAGAWLRANPDFLMTPADRVNENTRSVREGMITAERAVAWYALESASEVKPMWDEFYRAAPRFESYVHFRSSPVQNDRYYGLVSEGYRKVRDNGPWPASPENFNIFFFGGSTSFGVGPYWATVASYLQQTLGAARGTRPVRVYNFGRSGYQSTQEVFLLQRLLSAGHKPDMVIFLDGLNDFCFHDGQPSSWQTMETFFNDTNERYLRQVAGYGVVTNWEGLSEFTRTMPLIRLTNAGLGRLVAEPTPKYVKPAAQAPEKAEPDATLRAVINRYVSNMRQVAGIAKAFDIVPLFVWQPIPTFRYDLQHHLFNPDRLGCHINSKAGYPMMLESRAAAPLGESFIWAADMQQDLAEPLYVDAFHYTAPMSKRIAELIGRQVIERGLLAKGQR